MSARPRPTLLLLGAGGHARACIDVIEREGRFDVTGLIGTADEVGTLVFGYPVLGTDSDLPGLIAELGGGLVTVGQIKTPDLRMSLFAALQALGKCVPAIVSPGAHVSRHASLGEGTIVMHGAVVNAGAVVGRNCIINSLALVEHDSRVEDHCHVSTGARINSGVRVGEGSFIGSGATVRQGCVIGRRCIVGMGHALLADCPSGTQVPALERTQ
jgi:sugar O-acyltransferase (sialic acid O-acetyltransferase NeuD family)